MGVGLDVTGVVWLESRERLWALNISHDFCPA